MKTRVRQAQDCAKTFTVDCEILAEERYAVVVVVSYQVKLN